MSGEMMSVFFSLLIPAKPMKKKGKDSPKGKEKP
jgi:hypothetical protein